ncbi:DNA-processing protein DprA [Frankia sp. CiP3]|uniref:DNA-processing protein DprA n=1 Tax=Frankia sp. CiP3 TaxID=2880971 RepID=UPI001EF6C29B|nr:DNA-processing protein DprA [Frankia sp. CiP3]
MSTEVSTDAERRARVALSMIAQPGSGLYRAAGQRGPVAVWAGMAARFLAVEPGAVLAGHRWDGWRLVCPGDEEWPPGLDALGAVGPDETIHAPLVLWVRGAGHLAHATAHSVAITGTRAATDYGECVADLLAGDLAGWGWSVVAAAGYGIDAAALRAALRTSTPVVAVLASATDRRTHRTLLTDVERAGVVVSETLPDAPATRLRFAARRRLLAGLARGVVVVEAGLCALGRWTPRTPPRGWAGR